MSAAESELLDPICPHGPDEEPAPELEHYHCDNGEVVLFDPDQPDDWIAAEADAVLEVQAFR